MSTQDTLRRRLEFLNLDSEASKTLEQNASVIAEHLPTSLDAFYAQLRAFPEIRFFFSDEQQIDSAKTAQAKHWRAIAGGRFDDAYIDSVQRIGRMHAKIGLEPRWYIAARRVTSGPLASSWTPAAAFSITPATSMTGV